jgi:toxin ParE1/3/4
VTPSNVHFRSVAQEDVVHASLRYDQEVPGLGWDFFKEIDSAVERMVANPSVFRVIDQHLNLRKVRLKRFPYAMYFTIEASEIFVHGVIHAGRDTDFLMERMK